MSITGFENLSMCEKWSAINSYGIVLADRAAADDRLYLFALGKFYVEIRHRFSNLKKSGVVLERIFEDVDSLEPYLACIKIDDLFLDV